MPSEVARRRPARSARRLLLVFATTILAPGVILAGFGLRALTQERQHAEGQARDTLDVIAENLGRRLELDLGIGSLRQLTWRAAGRSIPRNGPRACAAQ